MKTGLIALTLLAAATATVVHGEWSQRNSNSSAENSGDRDAVLKSARDYSTAFNQGDAKAIAAMWTENGEYREAGGVTLVGRAAIEKSYADFFKANSGVKVEAMIKTVRFPAKDLAVEEGLLRQMAGPKDLPTTTSYVAVHVREGGQWKLAMASEDNQPQDRLEDLEWLLGEWTGKVKDENVVFSFQRDRQDPYVIATTTRTLPSKAVTTTVARVVVDPETGHIRSWSFGKDAGHSQALWHCDGKRWIIDCRGVLADGTPTAERIVLQRVAADSITWREIDRVIGETQVPDSIPMRLTRTQPAK